MRSVLHTTDEVIIAGAGIGGLCTALCLAKAGIAVRVLEQAREISEVGAGIQLSPNACHVLAALGLLPALQAVAVQPEALQMRYGQTGKLIFSIPAGDEAVARWGAPYLHIHRTDLIRVLVNALEQAAPNAIATNTTVIGYRHAANGVTVQTEHGADIDAALLVGAAGIRSVIRRQKLNSAPPRYTGNCAWRMMIEADALTGHTLPHSACVWVGDKRHAVTYRVRGGDLVNLVAVVEQREWDQESWTSKGSRDEALADFSGWHPIITTIISEAKAHYQWALFDRPALNQWHDTRAVLLGDACHPMLPFLAQGAAMAIEDAWVLAASLPANAEVAQALGAYQAARLPRTTQVQHGARANQRTFHYGGVLSQALVYGGMRAASTIVPGFINSRQDWIYATDVTEQYPLRIR